MSDERIREEHESYGVIKVSRCQTTGTHLFGSDVKHGNFIEVTICRARKERSISNDWIFGGDELISVWMSETQWGHFLSSFNQGSGTPVTLKHINRVRVPDPPKPVSIEHTFKKEVAETVQDALNALKIATDKLKAATEPGAKSLGKGDLKDLLSNVETAVREVTQNVPYVAGMFEETIEKKLDSAKTEFEGYIVNRLTDMGLNAAQLRQAQSEAPRLELSEDGEDPRDVRALRDFKRD